MTASFAQTATHTTAALLAPASPPAPAHSHNMASSAAPAAQTQPKAHKDRPHMHVKNWMTQPNGKTGVAPLDPSTVPKFVNQLTKPPVFVSTGTKFDSTIGQRVPLYEVTESVIFQQILPRGFPKTKVYAYGGKVNTAEPGQRTRNQTVFSTPGPTFEATADQRIFVHYTNDLGEPHMFPVDPTSHGGQSQQRCDTDPAVRTVSSGISGVPVPNCDRAAPARGRHTVRLRRFPKVVVLKGFD